MGLGQVWPGFRVCRVCILACSQEGSVVGFRLLIFLRKYFCFQESLEVKACFVFRHNKGITTGKAHERKDLQIENGR